MEGTATATTRERQHVHAWGRIQLEEPPSYMVTVYGPDALASMRYRECGCGDRVYHDVDSPEVLAHLAVADEEA